jgi:serine/threonine protein kinase
MPQVGDSIAGYTIERLLGRGGMGAVFLATHRRLGRLAALKVLAPEYAGDDVFRERFIRESQLAASLEHPDIVPIYDADEDGGTLFMAMRFVEGPDLRHVLRRQRRLTTQGTAHIVESVASALDAAHAAGLVHRDVKPANILIQEPGGQIFLSDFGIAQRRVSDGLTKAGTFVGSVEYCSPEQIQGEPLDGRADVYSLGCVAFHCLVGQPPFRKETEVAVIQAHLVEQALAVSTAMPGMPFTLDGVLETALAKKPDARYASAGSLAAALRVAISGRVAPPQPSRSQLPIFSRRRLTSRHPGSSSAPNGSSFRRSSQKSLLSSSRVCRGSSSQRPSSARRACRAPVFRDRGRRSACRRGRRCRRLPARFVPGPGSGHRPGGGRCRSRFRGRRCTTVSRPARARSAPGASRAVEDPAHRDVVDAGEAPDRDAIAGEREDLPHARRRRAPGR